MRIGEIALIDNQGIGWQLSGDQGQEGATIPSDPFLARAQRYLRELYTAQVVEINADEMLNFYQPNLKHIAKALRDKYGANPDLMFEGSEDVAIDDLARQFMVAQTR